MLMKKIYVDIISEKERKLHQHQKRNCVVIKNFSKLLAVDEAEEESEAAS